MAVTISYTVPGVPLLNQLDQKTVDGQSDENARMNCVFTSNAALATSYLGRPFYGDQLKDMDPRYGQGYVGGASEVNLVATMAALGITMTRIASSTQQGLIDSIHAQVAQGRGVIVTMPSQWNSAPTTTSYQPWNPRTYSGPSHVGLACGIGPGAIRVMNPWGGFWQDQSDSWWATRLLMGEVWVGTRTNSAKELAMVPTGWKDDGKTLTAPNGVTVVRGFRTWVLEHAWESDNWPEAPERAITSGSVEPGNPAIGPGSRQDFRYRSLGYTTTRNVYMIWTGHDLLALERQVAALEARLASIAALAKA